MAWTPNAYLNPAGPQINELNDNMEYLKAGLDSLSGATAPVGTIAWLGSSGAGSGYVMDGTYGKQSDGTWLWRPDLQGEILVEQGVSPGSISFTLSDGLSRTIVKKNWLFLLAGSGTANIVLGVRHANTGTIGGNAVSGQVVYGFQIPSGLTITFLPDTGITVYKPDGTTATSIVVAGPAIAWFLHGASIWRQV